MDANPTPATPFRQTFLITLTVGVGLFIIVAYYKDILSVKDLYLTIWIYGLAVPLLLLSQDTLIDLNDRYIFRTWLTIGFIFFIVYITGRSNSSTTIHSFSKEAMDRGMINYFANHATSSFKALPIFLICYWILNTILKRNTGRSVINTFRLYRSYNNAAQRKVYASDILINIFLYLVTFIAGLIKF